MKIPSKKKNSDNPIDSVRVSQGTYQKALITKLFAQLLIGLLVVVFVYICFAATIVRVVPSDAGLIPVKNNTYPGGQVPPAAQILVSLEAS